MKLSRRFAGALLVLCAGALVSNCSKPPETVTVVFSNDMDGEIRSCGCASKDYGGLGRRATFVQFARDTSDNFLLIEAGDFFGTDLNYGREKAELTLRALSLMNYDGVVLGEKDFGLGFDFVVENCRKLNLPVVMANLRDAKTDSLIFQPSRIVVRPGGLRVGIVGVLSERIHLPAQAKPERLRVDRALDAATAEVEKLKGATDLIVLLAHAPIQEARDLARRISDIDLVFCGHEGRPVRNVKRFSNAYVLQVPTKAQFMGVAYAVLGPKRKIQKFATDFRPLSATYDDAEAIVKLFKSYDMEIAEKEKARAATQLLKEAKLEKSFAGAEACKKCHAKIFDQWHGTTHAHAFDVLVSLNREYDRDCTPCHTTGFYKHGGFVSVDETPDFIHVQCEACHGNGHDHIRNPKVKTSQRGRSACASCHTAEQHPEFTFEKMWPPIEHSER